MNVKLQYKCNHFLTVRIGEQSRVLAKRNSRMLISSANLSRSSRNLQWVKSKFKSLRSNLHEVTVSNRLIFSFYKLFYFIVFLVFGINYFIQIVKNLCRQASIFILPLMLDNVILMFQ